MSSSSGYSKNPSEASPDAIKLRRRLDKTLSQITHHIEQIIHSDSKTAKINDKEEVQNRLLVRKFLLYFSI